MTIESITSREILDSRGHPTLATTVHLDVGVDGTAAVPSGASTGSHEAAELRDNDPARYQGRGVLQAVANVVGPIAKALQGSDIRDQRALDQKMIDLDGTVNKSKLGANAIMSVSLAAARARAAMAKQPLYRSLQAAYDFPEISLDRMPRPMMNLINGGRHADNKLTVQEFLVVPTGDTASVRIERGQAVYAALGNLLRERGLTTGLGDEGGYAPALRTNESGLDFLFDAISRAGLRFPEDTAVALDLAASTWYDAAKARYAWPETPGGLAAVGMIGMLKELVDKYHLLSIEDPLAEDDWEGWTELTKQLGDRTTIIGDDIFVTNPSRLERGIDLKAGSGVIIKVNQIGTLSEAMDTIALAQEHKYKVVVSHRSGETDDPFIADLAVAVGADFLKAGAPARGERVAKYNRLLAIDAELRV